MAHYRRCRLSRKASGAPVSDGRSRVPGVGPVVVPGSGGARRCRAPAAVSGSGRAAETRARQSRLRSSAPSLAWLHADLPPNRSSPVGDDLGRRHHRPRLRRCAGDPPARGRSARDGDASSRPSLAAARLGRNGSRDSLGAVAHRSARGLRLRGALDRLRPHPDREVRPRRLPRRRSADPRLRARPAAATGASRPICRRLRRPAGGWSGSDGSPSR